MVMSKYESEYELITFDIKSKKFVENISIFQKEINPSEHNREDHVSMLNTPNEIHIFDFTHSNHYIHSNEEGKQKVELSKHLLKDTGVILQSIFPQIIHCY